MSGRFPAFKIDDAGNVTRGTDLNRLRLGLARMDWVKALPGARRRPTVDALAAALLPAVAFARLGAPPMPPKARKAVGRQRAPGGGRRPNVTGHILASDVERALREVRVSPGRWRFNGKSKADGERNSPMLDVLALCWQLATEAPGTPGVVLRDLRRMGALPNRWELLPTRRLTATERRWLRGLAALIAGPSAFSKTHLFRS